MLVFPSFWDSMPFDQIGFLCGIQKKTDFYPAPLHVAGKTLQKQATFVEFLLHLDVTLETCRIGVIADEESVMYSMY